MLESRKTETDLSTVTGKSVNTTILMQQKKQTIHTVSLTSSIFKGFNLSSKSMVQRRIPVIIISAVPLYIYTSMLLRSGVCNRRIKVTEPKSTKTMYQITVRKAFNTFPISFFSLLFTFSTVFLPHLRIAIIALRLLLCVYCFAFITLRLLLCVYYFAFITLRLMLRV